MEAIIKLNLFNMKQNVFISDENNVSGFSPLSLKIDEIPDYILSKPEITSVHLFGNAEYIQPFVEEIKEKEKTKYNKNHIEFYINK